METKKQLFYLCKIDEIQTLEEDSSRGFYVDDQAIFIVKKDAQVHAYLNRCPHLGIPLEIQADQFLDLDNALIQCSTHGALFTIDEGYCIAGPCQGQSLLKLELHSDNNLLYADIPSPLVS